MIVYSSFQVYTKWLKRDFNELGRGDFLSAKRFIQLFICYAISMIVAILLTDLFNFSSPIAYLVVASIIGYVVITVPLTIMTLLKNKN